MSAGMSKPSASGKIRPRLAHSRFADNPYYVTFGVVMGLSG